MKSQEYINEIELITESIIDAKELITKGLNTPNNTLKNVLWNVRTLQGLCVELDRVSSEYINKNYVVNYKR